MVVNQRVVSASLLRVNLGRNSARSHLERIADSCGILSNGKRFCCKIISRRLLYSYSCKNLTVMPSTIALASFSVSLDGRDDKSGRQRVCLVIRISVPGWRELVGASTLEWHSLATGAACARTISVIK